MTNIKNNRYNGYRKNDAIIIKKSKIIAKNRKNNRENILFLDATMIVVFFPHIPKKSYRTILFIF